MKLVKSLNMSDHPTAGFIFLLLFLGGPSITHAGLVGHYAFEETSGTTLVDSSGLGNDGTIFNSGGSGSLDVSGRIGSAYRPGSNDSDYGTVAGGVSSFGIGGNNARTISFWFNTSSFSVNNQQFRLFGMGSGAGGSFDIVAEADAVSPAKNLVGLRYGNGNVYYASDNSGTGFASDTWYHVAVVYDGTNLDLESIGTASDGAGLIVYVNGLEVNTEGGNLNNGAQSLSTTLTEFNLGAATPVDNKGDYPGLLDEVRIFDRALSPSEVADLAGADSGEFPVINSFTASAEEVAAGTQVTLSWSASNYDSLVIEPGSIDAAALSNDGSGTTVVSVDETTAYTLTAMKGVNSSSRMVEIVVSPPVPASPVGRSLWTEWYRPVDQPVFSTIHGNNHDPVIFYDPELEYPYHLIVSHETSGAYLWRATSFSWDSADWELVSDPYIIGNHYEYDDGIKVNGTYYIYEDGIVYTYFGALENSSGNWTAAGSFPRGVCDDIGVFYEDGVFHIFGENGTYPDGYDGLRLSHYSSTTGLGNWTLVDTYAVDPNPDGGTSYGVGDPTIIKAEGIYYLFCDRESVGSPYKVTAWSSADINQPFEYLGVALRARSDETDDWDNYRIQDADIAYIPERKRFIMVCNMMDTDGDPGGSFPGVGGTRVIGTFYSKVTDGGFETYMAGFPGLAGTDVLFDADPDGDGATNVEEYGAGTFPDDGSNFPMLQLMMVDDGGTTYPAFRFDRITVDPQVARMAEVSTSGDLNVTSFRQDGAVLMNQGPSGVGAFYEEVIYRSTDPLEASPSQFLRVRTEITAP